MRYLSVCSGIEAASVAWHPLGWQPLAFSEIEAFPRAVLQHHYPDVPLHGDFTVLKDQPWIVDADVLVGGTPCQAFSVAGLRNSLADERGNLSLEFVRLADAIDNLRLFAGTPAAVIVWENVPGVLSVKDNAFGCFLAALAGDAAPYVPPRGRWSNAGLVFGPTRAVAWRILDAQYFGVAQRRRRVFVVASARAGFDPAAVLFEFEGVRRDTAPRREAGKVAPTIPSRSTAGGGLGTDFDCDEGVISAVGFQSSQSGVRLVDTHATLDANNGPRRHNGVLVKWPADIAPTLNAAFGAKQGLEDQHALGGGGLFVPAVLGALTAKGPEAMGAPEVDAGHYLPVFATDGQANAAFAENIALTLNSSHEQPYVAFHPTQDPISSTDGTTHALGCGSSGGQASVAVAFGGDVARTLSARHDSSPCADRGMDVVATQMAVRRLTPVECERLQGFPDNYTLIPWRKKPAEECPDGPRYKALGNSMAVPVMRWIGQRIDQFLHAHASCKCVGDTQSPSLPGEDGGQMLKTETA